LITSGTVLNLPLEVLGQVDLAVHTRLQGNNTAARSAYQDFLTLWKDADPDIPILRQARTAHARLK
jgi:eukaryotic-like serine/threonine-protein kinase